MSYRSAHHHLGPAPIRSLLAVAALSLGASSSVMAADAEDRAAEARERIVTVQAGTGSSRARRRAETELPLNALAPVARGKAAQALDDATLFRTLPVLRFPIHEDGLKYFVHHPDVAVALWRILGVSGCEMWQTGPNTYEGDAGDGSIGLFEVLLRGEKDQLVLVEGQFKSPVLKDPVQATCLFHLHTETAFDAEGTPIAVGRASLFISFPSRAIGAAAKLISPVTNVVLDRNFEEVCLFAHLMDRSMQTRPVWVEGLAAQMEGVLPRRKVELSQLSERVYAAGRYREQVRQASLRTAAPPVGPYGASLR
ncbi:hypothetical protein [Alienimonas chondri]|uniref:Uncharacterized protein n=1 Tax=Alienimonas chondri TaxID=2681879 RepID=A0ABX1VG94_9PLAN|nr:hypothetical protein [Alienimonas chondri]NNJ26288.1 hypothetical protein [Alienimonas chondri]